MRKSIFISILASIFLFGMLSAQQTSEIKMTNARLSELSVEVEVMGNIATTLSDGKYTQVSLEEVLKGLHM